MDAVAISLKDINKSYDLETTSIPILKGISLVVKKGDFLAITGPSGSGKSTLLNIIGLLDTATSGTYILNKNNVTNLTDDEMAMYRNKEIGFVFQQFNLLKRLTVLDNVILPAVYAGIRKEQRIEKAKKYLTDVGLVDQMYKRPNQLSGGQQQRVAIARALMNDPAIILADEPTGNLDTKAGDNIMDIIKKLNEAGKTIIMITHENDIAKKAKKVIKVRDGLLE